jgi:outer membrane receptor for ferric coprogen and ferric-rhodotorulic acid
MAAKKLSYLTLMALFSNVSIAQTEQDKESKDVENIEVTGSYIAGYGAHTASGASRLDLDIIDIPQSVSVISSAQMQDFQLNDINDALDSATGVNVQRIETDRTYYTARGFDITNFQIDGIGLPLTNGNNHADEDTAIYDRVEVIRGANGLMTGVGNPSATINFIRKRPTANTSTKVNASVGSWDSYRLDADVSTAITDDVSARFVAVKHDQDSYLDRYEKDKTLVYAFVEAKLSEDTTLSFSHSYLDSEAQGNNWGALPLYYTDGSATNYDRSTNTSADWSNWTVIKNNSVVELSHFFNNDWSLRATYSHKTTDEDTELFYMYGTPYSETELGLYGYASEYDLDEETNLVDVYVNGDFSWFNRDHQIVFGANYSKVSYTDTSLYDYTTGYGFPVITNLKTWDGDTPKPTFADGLTGSDVEATQKAVYFTGRFNLADGLHVIAGGRLNDWQVSGTAYSVDQDASDTQFIPYLGLVYEFMDDTVAYASYTETFVSQTELDVNNKVLDPVTGESKEIGIKRQWFDDAIITSLAYFDVKQVNLAKLDSSTSDLPVTEQRYIGSDGISSNGIELDIAGQVTDGLQLSFGYTNFDIDGDDEVAAYTPSQLLKIGATYKFQQWQQLSVGVNMRWQDETSRDQGVVGDGFDNAGETIVTTQEAYSVIDLMARYEFTDAITLTVNIANVTDEKYINSLYWSQGFYGAPVNYNATLSWKL